MVTSAPAGPTEGILPTLRDPELQRCFERDGIVVSPVLPPDDARALREAVLELLPDDPGDFLDLFRNNPPELRARVDDLVRGALFDTVSELFVDHDFWSATVLVKPPGEPGVIDLHTDWNMVDETRYRSGLLWLALEDTDVRNGGIAVVPGTNRLDMPYRGRDLPVSFDSPETSELIRDRTVQVDVPTGHAAIWDNRLLHGSGPNQTGQLRIAAAMGFKPRQASLYHFRRMADGVPHRFTIEREFFLEYLPFEDSPMAGRHVLDDQVVEPEPWNLTAQDLRELEDVRVITGTRAGRSEPERSELRWLTLTTEDTASHPDALEAIASRRLDGLTVAGVFSPDEAAQAVERLERYRHLCDPAIFGTMLGMSLADLHRHTDDVTDRTPYLDRAEETAAIYRDAFGFDPFERVARAISPLGGGIRVDTPYEDGKRYAPANIRWMEPDGGGLPAHVGNEFEVHTAEVGSGLRATTKVLDHYSWFVVLQTPEAGGALSVFDRLYESHEASDPAWGVDGRADHDFDEVPALRVAPEPGTLVFFGGGWRWHRVDRIEGSRPRVSYGGFAGPSLDGTALHLWF